MITRSLSCLLTRRIQTQSALCRLLPSRLSILEQHHHEQNTFVCKTEAAASFSSSCIASNSTSDAGNNIALDLDGSRNTNRSSSEHRIIIHVLESGTKLSISFSPNTSDKKKGATTSPSSDGNNSSTVEDDSVFHAAWLWSNCPSSIHPTSGQRNRTPGDYHTVSSVIESAVIISATEAAAAEEESNVDGVVIPTTPAPSWDCCHSTGTVYSASSSMESAASKKEEERLLVKITWNNTQLPSYYDLKWLSKWRYDDKAIAKRRAKTEITTSSLQRIINHDDDNDSNGGMLSFDYDILHNSNNNNQEEGVYQLLDALFTNGAILITNSPTNPTIVPHIASLLSYPSSLSHGALYGDTFDVISSPDAPNIAYTSFPLRAHQDLAYYESFPGLQILHCLQNGSGVKGGESLLIDALAAAYAFRGIVDEDLFRVLVETECTFVKQREGASMTYNRPHVVLKQQQRHHDDDGGGGLNREIVAVNWSPPFEGPPVFSSSCDVELYYAAYHAFQLILNNDNYDDVIMDDSSSSLYKYISKEQLRLCKDYAKQYTWERKLQPREMLIFNNRRMLHGRRGFHQAVTKTNIDKSDDGCESGYYERHFKGGYTCIDDTLNRYRTMKRDRHHDISDDDDDGAICNVGHGTTLVP